MGAAGAAAAAAWRVLCGVGTLVHGERVAAAARSAGVAWGRGFELNQARFVAMNAKLSLQSDLKSRTWLSKYSACRLASVGGSVTKELPKRAWIKPALKLIGEITDFASRQTPVRRLYWPKVECACRHFEDLPQTLSTKRPDFRCWPSPGHGTTLPTDKRVFRAVWGHRFVQASAVRRDRPNLTVCICLSAASTPRQR